MRGKSYDRFSTVVHNNDSKFDIQLGMAHKAEDRLAQRFQNASIELKTESRIWPRTGNIFIEGGRIGGEKTGINATEADFWCHELITEQGDTIAYIMMPTSLLREIAPVYGRKIETAGDGGRTQGHAVPLERLVEAFRHYGKNGILKFEDLAVGVKTGVSDD